MDAGLIRRHVVIRGRVQGVGFRYALASRARAAGVAGWVRNRGDGWVEAELEGSADAVDSLVRWCGEGPRGAQVDSVEARDQATEGESGFRIV